MYAADHTPSPHWPPRCHHNNSQNTNTINAEKNNPASIHAQSGTISCPHTTNSPHLGAALSPHLILPRARILSCGESKIPNPFLPVFEAPTHRACPSLTLSRESPCQWCSVSVCRTPTGWSVAACTSARNGEGPAYKPYEFSS